MSEFFETGKRSDIKNEAMFEVLKLKSMKLSYLEVKEIDIKDINTYSLRFGWGGGALHFVGYKYR